MAEQQREAGAAVRVGVLGLGRSGYGIHLRALGKLPEKYRVVAVADTNAARCAETAASVGCDACADIGALLAHPEVELVTVATQNRWHAEHAVAALDAGKHVLCEKPFGLTVAEVDAMLAARDRQAAKGSPVVLAPFQNRRYEESFAKVREVIRSGKLGTIVQIRMAYHGFGRRWDWQTLRRFGGGQLNNNLPHPLDQAMELLSDCGVHEPEQIEVRAHLRNALSSGDAEDHVRLTLTAPGVPDAPLVDIEFTAASPYAQDQWHVMGTAGGLRGTGKELHWKWVQWGGMPARPPQEASTPDRSYNSEKPEWQEVSHTCTDSFEGWAQSYYEGLYPALREGAALFVTPEQIRKRIAVLEKARAAAGIPVSGCEV